MIAICVIITVLTLFAFPITISLMGEADVLSGRGRLEVRVFGLTVLRMSAEIVRGESGPEIVLRGKKETALKISADKRDGRSVARAAAGGFIPPFETVAASFYAEIGKSDDALYTALALSAVRAAACMLLSRLRSRARAATEARFRAAYNRDALFFRARGIIRMSFADIIYGYISHAALRRAGKGGKNVDRAFGTSDRARNE